MRVLHGTAIERYREVVNDTAARVEPFVPTPVFDRIVAPMMDLGEPPDIAGRAPPAYTQPS